MVHGPVVLARATGIAVGLRCIYGYPTGLTLLLVLRARGVQAEAAERHAVHSSPLWTGRRRGAGDPQSPALLSIIRDDGRAPLHPIAQTTSSGSDAYDEEGRYWLSPLPVDRTLELVVGWPSVGLPEQTCRLSLDTLHDLGERVVRLL